MWQKRQKDTREGTNRSRTEKPFSDCIISTSGRGIPLPLLFPDQRPRIFLVMSIVFETVFRRYIAMGLSSMLGVEVEGFDKTKLDNKERTERRSISESIANELPYEEIFDGIMIFRDGSIGACFEVSPIYIDSMDDNGKEHFVRVLSGAFNALSPGMYAQILWRKDSYTPIIDLHREQIVSGDPLIHIMSEDRTLFWKGMVNAKQAFGVTCQIWIRKTCIRSVTKNFEKLWNTGRTPDAFIAKYVAEHEAIVSEFKDNCTRILAPIQGLTSIRQSTPDEMVRSIWRYVGGDFDASPYSAERPLRMSFNGIDVARKWGYLSMGRESERQVAIVSCDLLPSMSFLSMINYLLSVPYPITVIVNVASVAMDSAKATLRKSFKRYETFLRSRDPECEERAAEVFNLLQDLEKSSNQLVDMEFYTILEGKTLKELDRYIVDLTSKMHSDMDMIMKQEKSALFLCFKAAMPGACYVGTTDRHFRIKTDNLADIAPILGPMKNAERPVALMRAPYSSVYGYDLFDSRLPAAHGLIFGATGSGKSFATTLLLLSFMSQNPLVFIIDKGGSYKKLTKMLGGSYIDMADQSISFNPLEGMDGWQDRVPALNLMFQEMVRDDPTKPVDQFMRVIIERLVNGLYLEMEKENEARAKEGKPMRSPTLTDAYRLLQSHLLYREEEVTELAPCQKRALICLSKWTRLGSQGNSPYSRILDNPTTRVSTDNSFICFDLHGIEQYKDLMNVVFLVLNDVIKRKIVNNRQQHKIVVFDEVWSLLKTEEGANFLGELYRTMRKYQCMVLSISQDIEDFSNSSVAGALMSNTYQMFIMRQASDANADKVQQILQLNNAERDLVSQLRQRKGFYSEIFLRIKGVGASRMTLIPSPVEYWLATTDPEDTKLLGTYLDRGVPLEEAIIELARTYPNGVVGGRSN